MTTEDSPRSTFGRFITAINNHDLEALDELVHPAFVRHCQATSPMEIRNLVDFKAFLRRDRETFPDGRIEAQMTVTEGDKLGACMMLRGTQEGPMGPFPATGRRVSVRFLAMLRFEDGRIAEMWVEWDNLQILMQLGLFPPPTS